MPRESPRGAELEPGSGNTTTKPKPFDLFLTAGLILSTVFALAARVPRPAASGMLISEPDDLQLGDVNQGDHVKFQFSIRDTVSQFHAIDASTITVAPFLRVTNPTNLCRAVIVSTMVHRCNAGWGVLATKPWGGLVRMLQVVRYMH